MRSLNARGLNVTGCRRHRRVKELADCAVIILSHN